jgi:hypothetical protein
VSSIVRAVISEMLSDDVLLIEVEALIVKTQTLFVKNFIFLTILSLMTLDVHARHPWDCMPGEGDGSNYCWALHLNDFTHCDKISHEGMKFTCHARIRLNKEICSVIDSKKDRNYCVRIVSTEMKIRDKIVRGITKIPPENRPTRAWHYPN